MVRNGILQFNTWKGEKEHIMQSYFYLVCVASTRHALMPTCLGLIWRTFETQIRKADLGQDICDMTKTRRAQLQQLATSHLEASTEVMCKTFCPLSIKTHDDIVEDQAPHFYCNGFFPDIQLVFSRSPMNVSMRPSTPILRDME